jgi:tetratricopeptide (TPR) repeat protein
MASPHPDSARFHDQVVVFTGRLVSLARRDARALVARLGGDSQDEVTAKTTMLVVGGAGFPRDGGRAAASGPAEERDASRKLRRAHRLNGLHPGTVRILGEDEFCALAGLPAPGALKKQHYAASDIRAMYPQLRDDHLRFLEKWKLVRPVVRAHAERYFDFATLVVLRHVATDLAAGLSFRAAVRAADQARSGQLALDFRLEAAAAKVIRLADRGRQPPPARDAEALFLAASATDDGSPETREAAAAGYREALAVDPELVPAVVNLANIYYAQDRLSEAQALYEQAIALEADVFEAHFNLGNVHHDRGRFEEARRCYVAALALNPAYADGHFYLAVTLEKLGRSDEARPHWKAYRQLAPDGEWVELAREFSE